MHSHWVALLLLLISRLQCIQSASSQSKSFHHHNVDVAIIGSGIGGLTAAAILSSKYNLNVHVFESHYHAGGCAHAFNIKSSTGTSYNFDAGPTILLGCSTQPYNPLQQILQFLNVEQEIDWISYKSWGMVTEEGRWDFQLGGDAFMNGPLLQYGGAIAVKEFQALRQGCLPLIEGAVGIPSQALRSGPFKLIPLLRHYKALQKVIPFGDVLSGNFKPFMDKYVTNPWLKNWLDALAFSLSGLPASDTGAAAMAYVLFDLHRDGSALDYPRGGMGALSNVLVDIIQTSGSTIHLSTPVTSINVQEGRADGVTLRDGSVVRAKRGVLSNTNIWTLPSLLQKDVSQLNAEQQLFLAEAGSKKKTKSFLHLHLGLDSTGLNLANMQPHFTVMAKGLADPCSDRNMVAVSNPSVLDSSLTSRSDRMIVHAYGAGNEDYSLWSHFNRSSLEYKAFKTSSAAYLYTSVSRALDISVEEVKARAEVELIGSPLTHARYLRRSEGTYGSAWGSILPDSLTPLPGLFLCGDSVFPGIGVPAVALSGSTAANSVVGVVQHMVELMRG